MEEQDFGFMGDFQDDRVEEKPKGAEKKSTTTAAKTVNKQKRPKKSELL
jgi:hypothetical protein